MSRISSIISPLRANPIAATACIIHLLPVAAGLYGLMWPASGLKDALNFPDPYGGRNRTTVALVRMYAVRQFASGLIMVILFAKGHYSAMGWSLLVGPVIAGVDGWVANGLVGGLEGWKHWSAVPVALGLGWALALRD